MSFARLRALAVALVATGLFASPSSGQSTADAPTDPTKIVVATVGDGEITLADLLEMQASLPAQYRQVPLPQIYPALLERAIDSRLIAKAARAANISGREDVQKKIRAAEDNVLSEVYLSERIGAQVTDEALRQRYEAFAASQGDREEAHARHILLETEDAAKAVISELDKGADFTELAKSESTGPSGPDGGDLGWFTAEQMVPEFSQAAFALEPGSYTKQPVQSQFGWHVILLEEKRSTGAPPFEQVHDQLASEMTRELIQETLSELRSGTEVQRFGVTGEPIPAPQQ